MPKVQPTSLSLDVVRRLEATCRECLRGLRPSVHLDINISAQAVYRISRNHINTITQTGRRLHRHESEAAPLAKDPRLLFWLAGTTGTMGQRLRVARCMAGLTQKGLLSALPTSRRQNRSPKRASEISQHEIDERPFKPTKAKAIAPVVGVWDIWLLHGVRWDGLRFSGTPAFLAPFTASMNASLAWLTKQYDALIDVGIDLRTASLPLMTRFFCQRMKHEPSTYQPGLELWPWCVPALQNTLAKQPMILESLSHWDRSILRRALPRNDDPLLQTAVNNLMAVPSDNYLSRALPDMLSDIDQP